LRIAVHPDNVIAQTESSVIYGIGIPCPKPLR